MRQTTLAAIGVAALLIASPQTRAAASPGVSRSTPNAASRSTSFVSRSICRCPALSQVRKLSWNHYNNKRIPGTVPLEADGSAYFTAPAGRFVYFQLPDENGMMIHSMRSGTMLQSGERQGCPGCHGSRLADDSEPAIDATQ